MKSPLLKRLMRSKTADVAHSSAFGVAQNGGAMGAASAQSFEERMKIEGNRTKVKKYGDSRIVTRAAKASGAGRGGVGGVASGGAGAGGVAGGKTCSKSGSNSATKSSILRLLDRDRAKMEQEEARIRGAMSARVDGPRDPRHPGGVSAQGSSGVAARLDGPRDPRHPLKGQTGRETNNNVRGVAGANLARAQRAASAPVRGAGIRKNPGISRGM